MSINKFQDELRSLLSNRFSVTEGIKANYARGEDVFEPILPLGVAFPETTNEIFLALAGFSEHVTVVGYACC